MNARQREYREIIEDIVRHAWLLEEDEKAEIAAMLSTAESNILATMANNYPETVKITVDTAIASD